MAPLMYLMRRGPFVIRLFLKQTGQFETLMERSCSTDVSRKLVKTVNPKEFFELKRMSDVTFRSVRLLLGSSRSPAVYGGLLFAQSLSAAEKTVNVDMHVHSLHSTFLASAFMDAPVEYKVTSVRDGRTFCSRLVQAEQNQQIVLICQISFQKLEDAAITHQIDCPDVPRAEDCEDLIEGMKGIVSNDPDSSSISGESRCRILRLLKDYMLPDNSLFDVRPVNLLQFLSIQPSTLTTYAWMRSTEPLPADPWLHRMMLMYNTDAFMIGAAVRPHTSQGFIPSMVTTLDHSVWLHTNDFKADNWLLCDSRSTVAGGGRGFIEGKVWSVDGKLVCSMTQEAVIRSRNSKSSL